MAEGPCVTCTIGVRQIIRAMLLADAMAVACLRTEVDSIPRPNLADGRLLWALRETTRYSEKPRCMVIGMRGSSRVPSSTMFKSEGPSQTSDTLSCDVVRPTFRAVGPLAHTTLK
jgi:hypothetical protein